MRNTSMRAFAALVLASLMAVAGVTTSAQAAQPADDVVTLTNQQRATAGLPELVEDATLDKVAQAWAAEMSRMGKMEHSSNDWRAARIPAGWYANGENIAYGYSSAASVMQDWMKSPGHKENILRKSFTHIGVGYVASGNYWVQIFAGYDAAKAPTVPPFGYLDSVTTGVNPATAVLSVSGWAISRMSPTSALPLTIEVSDPYGTPSTYKVTADQTRNDVGAAYPTAGPNHGYSFQLPIGGAGTFRACVYSTELTKPTSLGCRTATLGPSKPIGWLDTATIGVSGGTPQLTAAGWVLDDGLRAAAAKAQIVVTDPSGRVTKTVVDAQATRPDVAAAFPGSINERGFTFASPLTGTGTYRVCVSSIGAAVFGSLVAPMTCRALTWESKPIGWVDSVGFKLKDGVPSLNVDGWVIDNNSRSSGSKVRIAVTDPSGRTNTTTLDATGSRPDVAAVFPGAGADRGFAFTSDVAALGNYRVCVSSVGAAVFGSPAALMTCQDALFASKPVGWVDKVAPSSGGIEVAGWVIDNALRGAPAEARVTVTAPNGQVASVTLPTTVARADVQAAFPGVGGSQGFTTTVASPVAGTYRVCVEAIGDPRWGSQITRLECRSIQR